MEYLYNFGSRVYNAVASIPADISRRLFRGVLNELLGPYLKDKLQLENLDTHFGDGVFTFRDLVLEEDMINRKLGGVKLTCRCARIDLLTVSAPYDLEADDLKIEAQGVTLVMSTSSDADLFRSAFSSAGGSMMQSVYVPDEEDNDEEDERPKVESNVYVELQENIADLLESLKLRVENCVVLVESKGHVFEVVVEHVSLDDSRAVETYTIGPDDESFASVAAKLGLPTLPLPLPPFAVGEVLRVPAEIEGLTCRMVQKWFRFRGLHINYLGKTPTALSQSGAGEDFLATIANAERKSVLRFDGQQDSTVVLELSQDKRIRCDVSLSDEQTPFTITLSEDRYRHLMATVFSVVFDELDESDEEERAQVNQSKLLSDFSIMYHQQRGSMIGNGPLQFASVFSDWSLLKSYSDTVLLRCMVEVPLLVIDLRGASDEETKAALTVRTAKLGFVSAKSLLQWTWEVDGGWALADGTSSLVSVFPSAVPFSVKGEMEQEGNGRKFLLAMDHSPPVSVSSRVGAVWSDLSSLFGASGGESQSETRLTFKLEWKDVSVMLDNMYDLSCNDLSVIVEMTSCMRLRLEAGSVGVRMDGVEAVSVRNGRLALFWKSIEAGGAASTVSPVNDASKLISVPFEGISVIWGLQSTKLKLTQSFVSSFSDISRRSSLHVDFACDSLLANLSQAQADRGIVWMRQPAAAPLLWTSWAVSVNGDCVVALLHESLARHDYCWDRMRMFGCVAMEQQDCSFVMLDAKRAQVFVSNPSANIPRALMWQKLGSEQNDLDAIELTNLKTCLVVSRLSVTRSADIRLIIRNCALSPAADHWALAGDFFGGPALDPSVDEEEQETETEAKWLLQAEQVSVLVQASSAHAILGLESCGAVVSVSGSRAWQLSLDVGALKVFLCNRDTLPPTHRYLDAVQYAAAEKNLYCALASLGGLNVGLMQDETISVNLINFQSHVLEMRTCSNSLATAVVLATNWISQQALQIPVGVTRVRQTQPNMMEASTDSLAFSDRPAVPAFSPQKAERGPVLAVVKSSSLEVHMFLLERLEEFKVGATVRIRWEYRKGAPTDYDWVAMYKTTRSRKSKNYYVESLTGGKKFGVLEWKVPNKLGSIHFRFFRGSGLDNLVAVSESFRVGPLVELSVTRVKSSLYVERVIVKNDPAYGWAPKATDWIGMYQWNQSNKNLPVVFKKVGEMSSVPFSVPSSAGRYVFRYFADMGWGQSSELARSTPFEVSENEASQAHDLVSRSDRQPKAHWQVSDFHVKWTMADGRDWSDEETDDKNGKKDEVMLQVQIPMTTLSYFSSRAKHSVQLYLTLGLLELHDRVARSNYRSLLQFPASKRGANVPCAQLEAGKLQHCNGNRWECRVDVAPFWLNVDQDTLIFVLRFGLSCHEQICTDLFILDEPEDPMEQSFVLLKERPVESPAEERVFETLSISAVDVEIDFRAKNRRMDDTLLLNRRKGGEFVYLLLYYASALLSVNESRLSLDTVLLRDVKESDVSARLMQHWFPQIQRDNVTSLLSGFEPVKFVFRLGEASVGFVQAPLGEYKQNGSLLTGLAEGGANLGKTIYVEAFRGLSNLLVGTGNVVKNVNRFAEGSSSSGSPGSMHVKAHSPADLQEGLALAGQEIARGFKDAFNGVFFAPLMAESASEAAIQVVRGMPGLVLKPVSSLFRAGSIPLRFAAASADPSISQRAALKYKRPEQEHQQQEHEEQQKQQPTIRDEE